MVSPRYGKIGKIHPEKNIVLPAGNDIQWADLEIGRWRKPVVYPTYFGDSGFHHKAGYSEWLVVWRHNIARAKHQWFNITALIDKFKAGKVRDETGF